MYFFCKMVQQISNMIKDWSELSASTELCMTLQMDLLAGSPTESFNEAKVLMDFWFFTANTAKEYVKDKEG